jgi:hypothetical protein
VCGRWSGGSALVPMVAAVHLGKFHDVTHAGRLDRFRLGRILAQRQMGPGLVVVREVRRDNAMQMALTEHDDMVQAFAAKRQRGERILEPPLTSAALAPHVSLPQPSAIVPAPRPARASHPRGPAKCAAPRPRSEQPGTRGSHARVVALPRPEPGLSARRRLDAPPGTASRAPCSLTDSLARRPARGGGEARPPPRPSIPRLPGRRRKTPGPELVGRRVCVRAE